MNSRRLRVLFIVMTVFFSTGKAADITMSLEEYNALNDSVAGLHDSISGLTDSVARLNAQVADCRVRADSLDKEIDAWAERAHADSLALALQKARVEELENFRRQAEIRIGRADTVAVQLVITRLGMKYSSGVNDALRLFDGISNEQVKKDYAAYRSLLVSYREVALDFRAIFQTAQEKRPKENVPNFMKSDYREQVVRKLKSVPYFQSNYKKDLSIPYLDSVISEALKLLDSDPVDLSPVLQKLDFE